MQRRTYLSGLAGIPALGSLGGDVQALTTARTHGDSHHPGPPRFMRADERLVDPLTVDYRRGGGPDGRNTLAPQVPDPERDPENYADDAFQWRVAETPADSDVDGFYESPDEYDYEGDNVAEFDPDVPGVYTLELDAPDGTHELTVRAFPEPPESAGGRPRVNPRGEYDADSGTFTVEANPASAPDSALSSADLDVEFYVDDRDALEESALSVDGATATVDAADLDERAHVYAVASGERHSVSQMVALDPEDGVDHVDQPPEWIENATMYEIFVRSFGSEPGEVDFQYLADNLDYVESLGIDVIWLTPIVEAASHREDRAGGPHGYDTINYFDTADALGSMADFEAFVDACHERDIRVCFDLVINHVDITHPFFEDTETNLQGSKYFNWFERTADGSPNNYFGWDTLMNINYQNVALREHILAAADFWSQRVDGFRCDIAYGVAHDFWKEVREVVVGNDADFFLLDETIPYQAGFAEQEFDIHFDNELHSALVEVGRGGVDATAILDAVEQRRIEGVPDGQVFLQYIENHDTRRYLDDNSLAAEKAAAAATFTLPGIPMVYYGAERAIADYADPRLDEKGHFRSFMNWEEYDEDHLAFYRALGEAREEIDALQFDADLVGAYFEADDEQVLAFGRDAGDQTVVVVLNFAEESKRVDLRGPVGTTDLISGSDVGVDADGETTTVDVDAVAVLETPSLSGLGTHVAGVTDEVGDDTGAGDAAYPEGVATARWT
ncbi:alpha-amylase [Halapricum sp. CBA1109]|uniref:alpha-amylase family glycosyl hydrolase n=1 Tax=Halapricum sp. CBA1109 TaxID=2668068 RepID=UPI0012F96D15|nr:alpha-amylase family glycosyl hydrolase [Halapricum sp. CBA1109]MUV88913.1 alpha-amylase [Halapricum sp. CBA1109]